MAGKATAIKGNRGRARWKVWGNLRKVHESPACLPTVEEASSCSDVLPVLGEAKRMREGTTWKGVRAGWKSRSERGASLDTDLSVRVGATRSMGCRTLTQVRRCVLRCSPRTKGTCR
jgi:hypothetical protein